MANSVIVLARRLLCCLAKGRALMPRCHAIITPYPSTLGGVVRCVILYTTDVHAPTLNIDNSVISMRAIPRKAERSISTTTIVRDHQTCRYNHMPTQNV